MPVKNQSVALPTLFAKAKTGKIMRWDITVEMDKDNKVWTHVSSGLIDGKQKESSKETKKGKNIGKVNETTPFQQAEFEARKKWEDKKVKEGYFENAADAETEQVISPMLAKAYEMDGKTKRKNDIVYPAFVQPKLDGIRCIAYKKDGKIVLLSRKGTVFLHMDHLRKDISTLMGFVGDEFYFDGELYSHKLQMNEIASLVKKEKQDDEFKVKALNVEYFIYDLFGPKQPNLTFQDRHRLLEQGFLTAQSKKKSLNYLHFVQTLLVPDKAAVKKLHDQYVADGYEGIMLRNVAGTYELGKRSSDLQKYKEFEDEEFAIVGFEEGSGEAAGTIIWVLETNEKSKRRFNAQPIGSRDYTRKLFNEASKDFSQFEGKLVTVKFQGKLKDGVPRFPKAIAIRDYE